MGQADSRWATAPLLVIAATMLMPSPTAGCPFCVAVSNTLTDSLREASAAVLAECVLPSASRLGVTPLPVEPWPMHSFSAAEVIKGPPDLLAGMTIGATLDAFSNADIRPGQLCLIVADPDSPSKWGTPIAITAAAAEYLRGLAKLPAETPERLAYFLPYLDHADKLIADDAYNEFARASLADVAALRERLDRAWVVRQLRAADMPVHRRRLCWTLLGIRGSEADIELVEELIVRSRAEREFALGLDAALGCYMTLGGERALVAVERDYLGNPGAEYTDVYSAVMAVRVHGTELEQFPQARLAAALRLVLNQPSLADLVIPDLARWEDWSVVDRLVELFLHAQPDVEFIRTPIVRYLRVCPLPEAAVAIEQLRQVDPRAVERAETVFAFPSGDLAASFAEQPETQLMIPPAAPPAAGAANAGPTAGDGAAISAKQPATMALDSTAIFLAGAAALAAVAVLLRRRRSQPAPIPRC
jgi:hypothetical protein